MNYNDDMGIMERYLFVKKLTDNSMERLRIQRDIFLAEITAKENQMMDSIAKRVAEHIHINTDYQKAILEVGELKRLLDSLGK